VAALSLVALVVLVLYLVLSWQGPESGAERPDAFDPGHAGYDPWSDAVDRGSHEGGGD
jgi:hypothetical protein